jgi:hypothetical protein
MDILFRNVPETTLYIEDKESALISWQADSGRLGRCKSSRRLLAPCCSWSMALNTVTNDLVLICQFGGRDQSYFTCRGAVHRAEIDSSMQCPSGLAVLVTGNMFVLDLDLRRHNLQGALPIMKSLLFYV